MEPEEKPFLAIVSGLPRSGTSMMMQMLQAGGMPLLVDSIREADEDNPKGYYEFEPVKRLKEDTSWVDGSYGKAVKMVYLLLYDLPPNFEYRVVFMKRYLAEVLASQNTMLRRQGREGGGVSDDVVSKLFHRHLEEFDQWVIRQPNFKVLYVNYNALLDNPETPLRDVQQFLNNKVEADKMATGLDRSLYRQRA